MNLTPAMISYTRIARAREIRGLRWVPGNEDVGLLDSLVLWLAVDMGGWGVIGLISLEAEFILASPTVTSKV